jgi:hypothetical protein
MLVILQDISAEGNLLQSEPGGIADMPRIVVYTAPDTYTAGVGFEK